MKHKLVSVVLAAAMLASSLTGCGSKSETTAKNDNGTITLKVFSNLPDRKNGQGLVEQMIIDDYMKENTNVKIEVEALDEVQGILHGGHAGRRQYLGTAILLRRGAGCGSAC